MKLKKISSIAKALVLTGALFTGFGVSNCFAYNEWGVPDKSEMKTCESSILSDFIGKLEGNAEVLKALSPEEKKEAESMFKGKPCYIFLAKYLPNNDLSVVEVGKEDKVPQFMRTAKFQCVDFEDFTVLLPVYTVLNKCVDKECLVKSYGELTHFAEHFDKSAKPDCLTEVDPAKPTQWYAYWRSRNAKLDEFRCLSKRVSNSAAGAVLKAVYGTLFDAK